MDTHTPDHAASRSPAEPQGPLSRIFTKRLLQSLAAASGTSDEQAVRLRGSALAAQVVANKADAMLAGQAASGTVAAAMRGGSG